MADVSTILLEYVCPTLGVIIGNVMFSAPLQSVHEANKRGRLGDLNPTPWAFMMGNCVGWVAYSYVIQNQFVFWGNAPGFLMSVWLNLSATKLQFQTFRQDQTRKSFLSRWNQEQERRQSSSSLAISLRQSNNVGGGVVVVQENAKDSRQQEVHNGNADENDAKESDDKQQQQQESTDVSKNANSNKETGNKNGQQHQDGNAEDKFLDDDPEISHADWSQQFTAFTTMMFQVASEEMVAPAPHERIVMGIVVTWVILFSLLSFLPPLQEDNRPQFVLGVANNIFAIFFYGAPLSTIFTVLRRWNSASIHLRTMITNTANSAFWTAYGISVLDLYIAVPNGVGVLLGGLQILLYVVLPRRMGESD